MIVTISLVLAMAIAITSSAVEGTRSLQQNRGVFWRMLAHQQPFDNSGLGQFARELDTQLQVTPPNSGKLKVNSVAEFRWDANAYPGLASELGSDWVRTLEPTNGAPYQETSDLFRYYLQVFKVKGITAVEEAVESPVEEGEVRIGGNRMFPFRHVTPMTFPLLWIITSLLAFVAACRTRKDEVVEEAGKAWRLPKMDGWWSPALRNATLMVTMFGLPVIVLWGCVRLPQILWNKIRDSWYHKHHRYKSQRQMVINQIEHIKEMKRHRALHASEEERLTRAEALLRDIDALADNDDRAEKVDHMVGADGDASLNAVEEWLRAEQVKQEVQTVAAPR